MVVYDRQQLELVQHYPLHHCLKGPLSVASGRASFLDQLDISKD